MLLNPRPTDLLPVLDRVSLQQVDAYLGAKNGTKNSPMILKGLKRRLLQSDTKLWDMLICSGRSVRIKNHPYSECTRSKLFEPIQNSHDVLQRYSQYTVHGKDVHICDQISQVISKSCQATRKAPAKNHVYLQRHSVRF